jgi:hypothetical protein
MVAGVLLGAASAAVAGNVYIQNDADYVAFEAEEFFSLSGDDFLVVNKAVPILSPTGSVILAASHDASGDAALLTSFTNNAQGAVASWRMHFTDGGTYRMYVRYSAYENGVQSGMGNEDSVFRGTTLNATVITNVYSPPTTTYIEGSYGWHNSGINYTVDSTHLLDQMADLNLKARESGFTIDRIVLSRTTNLTGTQLDALMNTPNNGPVARYTFEPSDTADDGLATDRSFNGRHATLRAIGAGSYGYEANTPAALGASSTRSLRLVENSTGGANPPYDAANLNRAFTAAELDLNNGSWTVSVWFNRDADTDVGKSGDDMIFHMGDGDGFGGGNELYLYANGATGLALHEYYNDAQAVNLATTGVARAEWQHAAVVHDADAGTMSLYWNGDLVGTDSGFTLNLNQSQRIFFGAHSTETFRTERWFDGMLDDITLWDRALSSGDVTSIFDGTYDFALEVVPEPGSLGLMLAAGGLALLGRRRLRR